MVKYVRLVSGDDLLCEIPEEGETTMTLKNVLKVYPAGDGVVMLPLSVFCNDKSIEVSKNHIVFLGDASEELSNSYNEKFGTGIVVAPSGFKLNTSFD